MIREPVAVALHLDERKLGAQEFKRLSDRAVRGSARRGHSGV